MDTTLSHNQEKTNNTSKFFLSTFFLMYFLFPTSLGMEIKFLAIFSFCLFSIIYISTAKKIKIRTPFLLYSLSLIGALVGVVAAGGHGLSASGDTTVHWPSIFRIIYFFVLTIFFSISIFVANEKIKEFCANLIFVLLGIQLLILLLQILGLSPALSLFYLQEKMRGLDSYTRGTGTFGNPNTLAITSIFSMVLIISLGKNKKIALTSIAIVGMITILSGSRTGLFIYTLSILLCLLFSNIRSIWKVSFLLSSLILALIIEPLIESMADYFPYLWEGIKAARKTEGFLEISSMSTRIENWSYKIDLFDRNSSPLKILFGAGFHDSYKVLDNEYLFLFLRTGLFGAISFFIFLIFPYAYSALSKNKEKKSNHLFIIFLILGLIWSFLFEFFSDFIMSVLFFFALSVCASKYFYNRYD